MFIVLAAIQAGFSIFSILLIPRAGDNALLFGLTGSRLLLVSIPSLFLLTALWALTSAWRRSQRIGQWYSTALERLQQPSTARRFIFTALSVVIISAIVLMYTTLEQVVERLSPLLVLLIGLGLQAIFLTPLLVHGPSRTLKAVIAWTRKRFHAQVLGLSAAGFLIFITARAMVDHIGQDFIGWNTTGAPVMDTDLLLLILLVLAILKLRNSVTKHPLTKHIDILLFTLFWIVAAVHWAGVPLQPSWYLNGPNAPYEEFAPASDALVYDQTAQNMLIGEGLRSYPFNDIIVRRPLYTFFIGMVYNAFGQDYQAIALVQSILFGVLPALAYLAAKQLSGRFAGTIAAVLVLLQGGTAIATSSLITVSHVKLLMTEIPSAIGVVTFIYLVIPWVHKQERPGTARLLAAGAVLGALLLIRFETALLLPVAVGFAVLSARWKLRRIIPGTLVLTIGLVLFVSPWLFRNYQQTGRFYLEVPGNRTADLIQRLFQPSAQPAPTKVAPRLIEQEDAVSTPERILSHYLHSNLQSVLIFPSTVRMGDAAINFAINGDAAQFARNCCSRENYVRRLPFWQWYSWDLDLNAKFLLPIAFNILILSFGLALAWQKLGWAGLMPFGYSQAHIMINAVARTSGGRYLTPVEWIWFSYYAIGLTFFVIWAVRLLRPQVPAYTADAIPQTFGRPSHTRHVLLTAGLVLLLGAVIPFGEKQFPQLYPDQLPEEWLGRVSRSIDLSAFIGSPQHVILHGRNVRLRYYEAGSGEPDVLFPGFIVQPYRRAAFFVVGPVSSDVVIPISQFPDVEISKYADVLVVGCRSVFLQRQYTRAFAVYFPEQDLLLLQPDLPEKPVCPLP